MTDHQSQVEAAREECIRLVSEIDNNTSKGEVYVVIDRLASLAASAPAASSDERVLLARDHRTKAGILWRVIQALASDVPLTPQPPAASSDEQDARRFAWFLSDAPKGDFITVYLQGVREHWSLDQWRDAIDAAMKEREE